MHEGIIHIGPDHVVVGRKCYYQIILRAITQVLKDSRCRKTTFFSQILSSNLLKSVFSFAERNLTDVA